MDSTTRPEPRHGRRSRRSRSLRSHFVGIVGIAILPLLMFSLASSVLFAREERTIFRRGATERTLALLTAVDTELKRSVAALEVLAASENLEEGMLDRFEIEARRVLARRREWLNIHLAPPSGVQLMNLLRPREAPFHQVIDETTFREVVRDGRPVVGNLFREPFTGRHVFAVRVPVSRDGELRYVLSALVDPATIRQLLSPQGLPPDWVGVVLDDKQFIVARTIGQELVGQPASDSLRAALASQAAGWFLGSTIEGWPVYTPFNRSAYSGWSVAMGIPSAEVEASLRRSMASLAVLAVLLLGMGLALAWVLSARSVRSLEELAALADDLGMGRLASSPALPPGATRITEVAGLRRAFERAAQLIRTRSEERDRVERSLREVDARLRESEQRKDHFLAMLGHELRNPLGVISTASQLLRDAPSHPLVDEPRAMIERQASHMTKLLDDLLDVSRIAEGRIQVKTELCDLVEILEQSLSDHRGLFERSDHVLDSQLPGAPLWVMGDRTRLCQVIGNVLQNANKYTDRGGRVSVRLGEDARGEWAILSVRDTGVGMTPEVLESAFEPFSQADSTLDRSRGGLGLGLALVRGLVELHGGTVEARSEGEGCGTEIELRLPLAAGVHSEAPAATTRPTASGALRYQRMLVIEDNLMAAQGMRLYMERAGFRVEVAHSGPEGIERAERFRPEVVLCDIGLPGFDGYEVARQLRAADPPELAHLIAISGYGQAADHARAREAGFDRLLNKPVDLVQVLRILDAPPASDGRGAKARDT